MPATKMDQWLQHILLKLGVQVSYDPTPIYEDIHTTIYIIKATHLISRVTQIYIPFHHFCEQYVLLTIDTNKFKTTIQTEYIITKSSTDTLLECHYSYKWGIC